MGKPDVHLLKQGVCKNIFHCGNGSVERTIYESYVLTFLRHAYAYQLSGSGVKISA